MAILSPDEFSVLCGIERKHISTYVGRKNIIADQSGNFDTELELNKSFYHKKIKILVKKGKIPPEKADVILYGNKPKEDAGGKTSNNTKVPVSNVDKVAKNPTFDFPPEQSPSMIRMGQLDTKLKETELGNKEISLKLNQQKLAKQQGELIPTELVNLVFLQHSKSIATAFKNGTDNLITSIKKRLSLSNEDVSSIRVELIAVVNEAINESIVISQDSIENIVSEYKEKRGVGERT